MPTFEFFLDSRGLLTKELEIDVTATLPKVTVQVFDGDDPVDLTGAAVTFTLRDAAGAAVVLDAAAVLLNATQGIVEYQLADADVDDVGFFFAQFKITISGESYLIPNDSTQRLRLRIGKEDLPAFSSVPQTLPVHAGSHDLGGSDQIALEALIAAQQSVIWVDISRPASPVYTEDGSFARPYRTIEKAVADSLAFSIAFPTDPDGRQTIVILPGGYNLTAPLVISERLNFIGLSSENTFIRGANNADVFQVNYSGTFSKVWHFSRLQIIVQTTGFASIRVKGPGALLLLAENCRLTNAGGVDGFGLAVEHTSGSVGAVIRDANYRFTGLSFPSGKIKFDVLDDADNLFVRDAFIKSFESNSTAKTAKFRFNDTQIGHGGITGGNKAQEILASNCWTDDGDETLAPLDALDFRGLHTFKIVG